MTRCRNCGDARHVTQECKVYGPWYPEPGKTKDDYWDEHDRIARLVAVDVLHEHELNHESGTDSEVP